MDVQLLSGVDFQEDALQPQLKKRKIAAKAPRGKAGKPKVIEDAVVEVKVCIPVMVNVVPLKDGQELISHRPKIEKRAREPAAITMATLAKQVRTAKVSAAAKASGAAASGAIF